MLERVLYTTQGPNQSTAGFNVSTLQVQPSVMSSLLSALSFQKLLYISSTLKDSSIQNKWDRDFETVFGSICYYLAPKTTNIWFP